MADIKFEYLKLRKNFGKQLMFCEMGPEFCDTISPDTVEQKSFTLRNPVHQSSQGGPIFSKHSVNHLRAEYNNTGVNHAEGGWPKDVHVLDPESTQRYRRKLEKEEDYIHCVMSLAPEMDHYILQNNGINMYNCYYSDLPQVPPVEKFSCRTVNVYRDPNNKKRRVRNISFQAEGGRHFASAYCKFDFFRKPMAPVLSYVWDIENALEPNLTISPDHPLLDLQFSPRETSILIGGQTNGQVCAWDTRVGGTAILKNPPHTSHRDLAKCLKFIATKSGGEFFSSGPDGVCKWWDLRKLSEPTDEVIIDYVNSNFETPSMARSLSISVIEYEVTIPTRFMVGSETGEVVSGNRKGKNPLEKLPNKYDAHTGVVNSLERNPGFAKNFVTVGDFSVKIWSEECRESAVIWAPAQRHKVTAATWSVGRLSLLLCTQFDGKFAMWDILRCQYSPALTIQLCEDPLLTLKNHENATLVGCGSQLGNVYMVELSQSLSQTGQQEKVLLTQVFERESRRERILEARRREIKLKTRQAHEGSAQSLGEPDPSIGDADLKEATTDFQHQVKKELASMM